MAGIISSFEGVAKQFNIHTGKINAIPRITPNDKSVNLTLGSDFTLVSGYGLKLFRQGMTRFISGMALFPSMAVDINGKQIVLLDAVDRPAQNVWLPLSVGTGGYAAAILITTTGSVSVQTGYSLGVKPASGAYTFSVCGGWRV